TQGVILKKKREGSCSRLSQANSTRKAEALFRRMSVTKSTPRISSLKGKSSTQKSWLRSRRTIRGESRRPPELIIEASRKWNNRVFMFMFFHLPYDVKPTTGDHPVSEWK